MQTDGREETFAILRLRLGNFDRDVNSIIWFSVRIPLLTYTMVQRLSWAANWFAASQKFHAFHGTRRFVTAPTSVRHLSVSWASPIQSIYPHPTCEFRYISFYVTKNICCLLSPTPTSFSTSSVHRPPIGYTFCCFKFQFCPLKNCNSNRLALILYISLRTVCTTFHVK